MTLSFSSLQILTATFLNTTKIKKKGFNIIQLYIGPVLTLEIWHIIWWYGYLFSLLIVELIIKQKENLQRYITDTWVILK